MCILWFIHAWAGQECKTSRRLTAGGLTHCNREEQRKLIGPAEPPTSSTSPADAKVVLFSYPHSKSTTTCVFAKEAQHRDALLFLGHDSVHACVHPLSSISRSSEQENGRTRPVTRTIRSRQNEVDCTGSKASTQNVPRTLAPWRYAATIAADT